MDQRLDEDMANAVRAQRIQNTNLGNETENFDTGVCVLYTV